MITVPPIVNLGRDTAKRRAAREALAHTLWSPNGSRRLPSEAELSKALDACDARDVWWVCEMASPGPVYLLPTREWVSSLRALLRSLSATRVLEVAAGDGFLSRCVRAGRPRYEVIASDDGSWAKPARRMSATDREEFRGVDVPGLHPGREVAVMPAKRAVETYKPDVVLVSWAPPGPLVEQMIRAKVRHVVEVGVDGDVCGDPARTWKYNKELLDGPIESRAFCRLDGRGAANRRTRVTTYYGRAHDDYFCEG